MTVQQKEIYQELMNQGMPKAGCKFIALMFKNKKTRTYNDEVSNLNKRRTYNSDTSIKNGTSNSNNVKYTIQEGKNNSLNIKDDVIKNTQ